MVQTILNDAVEQGYFVIQLVRNSAQSERAGSNPVMSLFACCSFTLFSYITCRSIVILRSVKSNTSRLLPLYLYSSIPMVGYFAWNEEAVGSSPACYTNRCRRGALLRGTLGRWFISISRCCGIAQLVRANVIVAFRIITLF